MSIVMPKLHLYFHTPTPIFKARVNMASVTYPVTELTFDTVTLGAYTDIEFDSTLLLGTTEGADDLGRVRVQIPATSDTITICRTGRGIEDGALEVQDDAYITVLDDFRVWAKIPYFDLDAGIDYKDSNISPGTYNTNIPPVANTGPGFADYIDSGTSLITVQFPAGGADLSFAMADGATISSYAWDVDDGTITVGTASSSVITATFPAGFRYVKLTVTDSNAVTHTSRCPVLAIDPDDDLTFGSYQATQTLQQNGQKLSVEVFDNALRSDYPDGTLVMFWWDAPATATDRSHMKFIGWISSEDTSIDRNRQGIKRGLKFECLDVCGRLAELPGFPQALERSDEVDYQWAYMPSLDMNKALYYILFWHSTAINVADFFLPTDGATYDALRIDSNGGSIFNQMNNLANKIVPDHAFVCNSKGQMTVIEDWRFLDVGDRPSITPIITEDDWNDLKFTYTRHPKAHVLRSGALLATTTLDSNGEIPIVFCIAPGSAQVFGQGMQEMTENEGLALSQAALNTNEGHRWAMINSRYGDFSFSDNSVTSFWDYEPALYKRVQLNIGATYADQRGLSFTSAAGMIKSVTVTYKADKKGTSVDVKVVWNKEESGTAAETYVPEVVEDVGYTPPAYTPPSFGDSEQFYGDMQGYVLWGSDRVFRTWDLQATTPTWEFIDTGVTGYVWDCQYVNIDADTIGAWLLTSDGVWWCADIMATTPSWSQKLTQATIIANEVQATSGDSEFRTMFHYWLQPGHLCVATSPPYASHQGQDPGYPHAYFWVTEDYGETWTMVDMTAYIETFSSEYYCGYCYSSLYAMNASRNSGTIWCIRNATSVTNEVSAVFYSDDLGYTWTKGALVTTGSNNFVDFALLNPFPNDTDPSWATSGSIGVSNRLQLQKSTDAWLTKSDVGDTAGTDPVGYRGVSPLLRPNKRTFDNTHVLVWMITDEYPTAVYNLMESTDTGATWSFLYEVDPDQVDNAPNGSYATAAYNTPNGWPPDTDQWVITKMAADALPLSEIVLLTLDNFATTPLDKTGNLGTLLGSNWIARVSDGFALPRIGTNV